MDGVRTLGDYLVYQIFGLLVIIVTILIANIYLFVRRKKSVLITNIHITSFFAFLYFLFSLIQLTIIQLEFKVYYIKASWLAGFIGLVLLIHTAMTYIKEKAKPEKSISPDLFEVFRSSDDLSIIIDDKNNIVDINHSTDNHLFGYACETLEDVKVILIKLSAHENHAVITYFMNHIHYSSSIEIEIVNKGTHYLVVSSPIAKNSNICIGYTLLFHDITEEKELIKAIKRYNENLDDANNKLSDYVKIAEKLESEKERKRLIGEIQDDLVKRIDDTVTIMDCIEEKETSELKELLNTLTEKLRDIYKTIRNAVQNISNRKG